MSPSQYSESLNVWQTIQKCKEKWNKIFYILPETQKVTELVYTALGIVSLANIILFEWIIFNGLEQKPRLYIKIRQIEMRWFSKMFNKTF